MKHRIFIFALVAFAMFCATSNIYSSPECMINNENRELIAETGAETAKFTVEVCINALFIKACFELECELHWSDAVLPGLGQLFSDEWGCKVKGMVQADGNDIVPFQGQSEDMIIAIESGLGMREGTLKELTVSSSDPFLLPDKTRVRVVPRTYQVLKGSNGRYLPLEVERI